MEALKNMPTAGSVVIVIIAFLFVLAVALITLCCIIFVKAEPLEMKDEKVQLPIWRTAVYLALFLLSVAIVFRGIPYWIGLIVIPAALVFLDRKALKMVDYPLLLTFVFFFVFSGNLARIEAVKAFFSQLLSNMGSRNTVFFTYRGPKSKLFTRPVRTFSAAAASRARPFFFASAMRFSSVVM